MLTKISRRIKGKTHDFVEGVQKEEVEGFGLLIVCLTLQRLSWLRLVAEVSLEKVEVLVPVENLRVLDHVEVKVVLAHQLSTVL